MDLVWREAVVVLRGVVGAEQQDYMGKAHADEQRDDAERHHPVLDEEPLRPNVAAADTHEDDGEREARRPPAHQQRRVDLHPRLGPGGPGVQLGGEAGVHVHREERGEQSRRPRLRAAGYDPGPSQRVTGCSVSAVVVVVVDAAVYTEYIRHNQNASSSNTSQEGDEGEDGGDIGGGGEGRRRGEETRAPRQGTAGNKTASAKRGRDKASAEGRRDRRERSPRV
ncbi:hypothetical protein HL42_8120 [Trichophyton rubrum]|nr:hypothetical protein HL42_8120 [Trichophyton rubrum]